MRVPLLAAVAILTASLPAQQSTPAIAVRSLVPLRAPELQFGTAGIRGVCPSYDSSDEPHWAAASPQSEPLAPLVQWLQQRFGKAIAGGELTLTQQSFTNAGGDTQMLPALTIGGTSPAVETCIRELDGLATALTRPIELMAWRLPLPAGDLPTTHWSASTTTTRIDAVAPIWNARGVTRSGGGMRLGDERWLSHVRDYDVEVAEKARIDDPKVDLAFAGLRLGVRVHELPGEQLLLEGEWLLSEPLAMHEQATGQGQPTIDEPEHRLALVGFGGRIQSGGALVVSGRGGGVGPDAFLLVVRARFLAPPTPVAAPDVLLEPVSALLVSSHEVPACDPAIWLRDAERFAPDGTSGFGQMSADALLGLLPPESAAVVASGALWLHAPPAACAAAARMLQALRDQQLQSTELRSELRGAPAPLQLARPLLLGRVSNAFVGWERTVVADYEVEIAQKAQRVNPVVRRVRAGLWSRARAVPLGNQLHVEGIWEVATQGPLRERLHASEPPALLQLTDVRSATFPWDGPMSFDNEQDLGDAPPWSEEAPHNRLFVRLSAAAGR